jgi:dTDP-4-dehydrorhamnose reductase
LGTAFCNEEKINKMKMKNILVTGANGQLGNEMRVLSLENKEYNYFFTDVAELDICDEKAVMAFVKENEIDVIVNCAAYTAVDKAEDNQELCAKLNSEAVGYLAKAAEENQAEFIQISTDYVFDGQGTRPWEPDDPVVKPLNVYGQAKYDGEVAVEKYAPKHYIVRIAWVFGLNGKNFIKTMLNLGKTHDTLTVVDDQIGTPTYTYDLARLLVDMLEKEEYGKYHATNEGGYISWCDFAKEIFRQAGMDVKVLPVSSAEYPAKAKRPTNSRLEKKKLEEHGFTRLPDWKDALGRYLKEIQ